MAIALVCLCLLIFFGFGFIFYSKKISTYVFGLNPDEITPSHDPELFDAIDYLPVKKHILWGHHFTSVAGAAPIIGPSVAIIWGFVPALLWIVLGTLFIGAMHDLSTLIISARHQGKTMGDIAGIVINKRVRLLFQTIVYFLIWVVLAVFAIAIGVLFEHYPATVIPVNFQILVALVLGYLFHVKKINTFWPTMIAFILLLLLIPVGVKYPLPISSWMPGSLMAHQDPITTWALLLIIYAGIASVLPVWLLLQPRDYINAYLLIVGLTLLILGLFALNPEITAPAIQLHPKGAPPMLPFIFITIACGAISGFHGLVSSGTTSKQLNKMNDAVDIGYGSALGEGLLAVMATIAVAAGLDEWAAHYHTFDENGIKAISNFVLGGGKFLTALHFSSESAKAIVAILVICFAATSMDTGARIQRLIVTEIGTSLNIGALKNRYVATCVAIFPSIPLILAGKNAWAPLWMLFGTTNQLIGAMSLLVIYIYLLKTKKPVGPVLYPLIFLTLITTLSMGYNLWTWFNDISTSFDYSKCVTLSVGTAILVLEFWLMIESWLILQSIRRTNP